jgi:hypothetical protein
MDVFLVCLVVLLLLGMVGLSKKNVSLAAEVSDLNDDLAVALDDVEVYQKRCNEVEDAMEKGYAIQVRTTINKEIDVDFTKLEMVTIMAGVDKLYRGSENRDDVKFYIALSEKIGKIVENMEE